MRFREQGPPPRDDVEDKHPPDQDQEARAYDSTEEFEAFMNQDAHFKGPAERPSVRRTSTLDHARLFAAMSERYETMYCDRRDPTTSWTAAHKVASLLSTWITEHVDGDVVTHFDLGPHKSVHDLLADPRQFQLVFMQTANHFHDRVLPATCTPRATSSEWSSIGALGRCTTTTVIACALCGLSLQVSLCQQ